MKKFLKITLYTFLLLSIKGFATTQINDILIFNEKRYPIQDYFLEEYFKKNPDKKPKSELQSSDLWRGYVAEFKLADGKLFLTDIKIKVLDNETEDKFDTKFKSVYNDVISSDEFFYVNWVNTLILIPNDEPIDYELGYGATFKSYNLLEFKSGKLIFNKKFDLKKYKQLIGKKYFVFLEKKDLENLKKKL